MRTTEQGETPLHEALCVNKPSHPLTFITVRQHNTSFFISLKWFAMSCTSSADTQRQLRRDLKYRHLAMIAIGGSIGTGLFVASGATIADAGQIGRAHVCIPVMWPYRMQAH